MTKAEISELVTILAACYPNARLQPGNVLAYENFLAGLDHERAQKAIGVVVRSSKFMPSIAEICAAYEGISSGPRSDEPPYHKAFEPTRETGKIMRPHELSEAISAFLQKGKRGQS